MQPYDYTLRPSQQNIMTGIQQGVTLSQIMDKAKQEEAAKAANIAMQTDLANLSKNPSPTAEDYSTMMNKYPKLSEQLKRSFDVLSEGQKKTAVTEASQVSSAINADRKDIALGIFEKKMEAAINSGNKEEENKAKIMIELIKTSPEAAKTSADMLWAVADPEKFAENLTKIQTTRRAEELQPAKVIEAESKAQSAAAKANFAESEAVIGLAKQGWDIAKIQNDIEVSKDNKKIAAAKSALDKETNDLKRRELTAKVDKMDEERDTKVREKTALASSARTNLDNLLNTADMINNIDPNVLDNITGALDASMLSPTIREDSVEAEKLFETLKAQMFLVGAEKMKGLGTLTEMEGKKLENSYQNVDLAQSRETLIKNIKEIQRLALKNRANIATRYGVPDTLPDTPAAELTTPEIDELLLKYGE